MTTDTVSALQDFAFNRKSGGIFSAVTAYVWRLNINSLHCTGIEGRLRRVFAATLNNIWTKGLIGSDLPANVQLGRSTTLAHGGRGIFISEGTVLGDHVTLHQQVTIGVTYGKPGSPRIGSYVYVSAKASVIGPVTVGDYSIVGAHAAVVCDVPENSVALGVPARAVLNAERARLHEARES